MRKLIAAIAVVVVLLIVFFVGNTLFAQTNPITSVPASTPAPGLNYNGQSNIISGAWTDASYTATATASVPTALAAVTYRTGLHIVNVGTTNVACFNYTSTAVASGAACAPGSIAVSPNNGAWLEDGIAGNVSPEAISIVCAGSSCPLTIKVR